MYILVASNDSLTRFWRLAYSGGTFSIQSGVSLCLTFVSPEKGGDLWDVYATSPFRVNLPKATRIRWSHDRAEWKALPRKNKAVSISERMLGSGRLCLEVQ